MENKNLFIVTIRQFTVIISFLFLLMQTATAQNINRIEYYYDTDPGFGLGTSVTFTPAADISSLAFTASISALSSGFHTLYVRSRDANNKWSLTSNQPFVKYSTPTGLPSAVNIVKMEYFVDTDPGFGQGTNVPVTPSLNISAMNFTVPITSFASGFHTLYVRTKDADGKWSLTQNYPFVKYTSPTGLPSATNIVKMEYFIDTDPGVGSATNVPVTASTNISGMVFNVPLASVSNGFHTLYIRTKDADDKWSITANSPFVKYSAPTGLPAATNIVKIEYFVDTDPGLGTATDVPVTAALSISGLVFSVPLSSLANGFHTLYVRSKDANGKWSITSNSPFVKYASPTGLAAAGNVIKMEYFIDTDPGFGNGGNIPFTHSNNVVGLVTNIDLTSVANGFHTMYIRSMDTLGKWSITNYASFSGGQLQAPTANITVNGPTTFCLGSGTYLQANYSASATYQWKLNNNNINGATGITYTPTQTGSYTVVVTNAVSSATSSAVSITVNPIPTATISANGPLTFCQGGSVTLSVNATANATYLWRNNGVNINGATTTSYVANQSGIYDVKVTSTNGCSAISAKDTVTVNPSPSATITPSGSTTFCTGDSVILYGNTGSGLTYHWSNNATTGFIKVFTQGNYSLTVTNTSNCSASAVAVAVTVLTAPTATITPNGPTTFCNGGSVVLAGNTGSGLSYSWTGGATTSSITVTSSGTYYVTVSNTGCSKVSSPVTVTVNPGPTVGVTGTSSTVCQGHTDTLTASGATTYSWSPSTGLNITTGTTVYATPVSTTTYTVTGTTSGCIGTASFTVNVNANNTQVSTTTPTICNGSSAVLNASGANTYSWSPSGTLSGSTGSSVSATPTSQTTYTVTGTSGSCTSTASITINVNSTVVPSVTVVASQNPVCAGTSVTITATPVNGGSFPTYQWYKNGVLQGGSSNTFASISFANNDSVWCIMTSNAACPSPATATSNKIYMTVNPAVTPTISISANQNPVCTGDSITFTASITNGGASPTYVWKRNNVTVGGNSATYKLVAPVNNDSVWCVLTSNAPCASPTTVTSAKFKVIVNQVAAPTVAVSASQNPICSGATVVFSAVPTNGGTSPIYQWYKNGNFVGISLNTYTDNSLTNNDSVWCVMLSNATCASPLNATSNKVVIVIAPQVTPSVIVSTQQASVCAGSSVTFTAAPTNGGTAPNYQWYKNGVTQSGNTNTYTSVIANNDSVWCIMTSNATCPVPTTSTSNKVHMTVNPTVTPTISITSSASVICAGDSVTFTATITNGGTIPVYQWKRNNVNVGNGTAVYGTSTLASNDSVWCVLTSTAVCPSPTSISSSKIHMTVNPIVIPSVLVNVSQNPICTGASVTFTAVPTNGGSSPIYQWYKNGNTVGINSNSYTNNALTNSDSVWVVLLSNANCASVNSATSNKVVIVITPTVTPSVTVSTSLTTICSGTSATFTASPTNGGTSPTYQWYKNGVLQAGNTGSYSSSGIANNDSVWCVMTSNAQCPSPATASSNKVHMTVDPVVVPTITVTASQNSSCVGDSVTFTTIVTNGGSNPVYQWKKNNGNVGSGLDKYGTTTLSNNDSVWCVLTSNATCASPLSVTSGKVHMTVNPIVTPTVSVSASANPACEASTVTFISTVTNGGNSPAYQWYKNGGTVGTGSSYSDNTLVSSDSVWCIVTSNAVCASVSTITSSSVVMTVTPTVTPSVFINASQTTLCAGTSVSFTASATNGGANPTYQWYKNGVLQAGNTGSYSTTTLSDNDSVWCVMTSSAVCPLPANVTGNKITVSVLQLSYSSYNYFICQGESYNFNNMNLTGGGVYTDTITSMNGCDSIITLSLIVNSLPVPVITKTGNNLNTGVYVSYQWLLNGIPVNGANSQTYTAVANGSYTVLVTDANGCSDTSAAVSVTGVGIWETQFINLLVYPNPAYALLNISADNLYESVTIELRDDLGRLLYLREVNENILRMQLDVNNFASGIYLLTIRSENQIGITKRIFIE